MKCCRRVGAVALAAAEGGTTAASGGQRSYIQVTHRPHKINLICFGKAAAFIVFPSALQNKIYLPKIEKNNTLKAQKTQNQITLPKKLSPPPACVAFRSTK